MKRRQARILILNALFSMDVGGATLEEALEAASQEASDPAVLNFVKEVCRGIREEQAEIDRRIEDKLKNWRLERLSRVDRNLLRLGVYELLHRPDVPPAVAINEAVELAKIYGDEKSGAFVNGLLDAVRSTEVMPP
ncbi:MAG: transcription antitermination factor NusB [Candidatus Eremiobacterota bacterium]